MLIYKYMLSPGAGIAAIDMVAGAKIISGQAQFEEISLWAEVGPE